MLNKLNFFNTILENISASVDISSQKCTRIKHKSSPCTLCHQNCPKDAITVGMVGTKVSIDFDKCNACGTCVSVCPVQVFTLKNSGYKKFIDESCESIRKDGRLTIACVKKAKSITEKFSGVECVGFINVIDILVLYLRGARNIAVKFADCKDCPSKNGRSVFEAQLRLLIELSSIFADLKDITITNEDGFVNIIFTKQYAIVRPQKEEKQVKYVNRRGLFTHFKESLQEKAMDGLSFLPQLAQMAEKDEQTQINLEKSLPRRRKLFLDIIMNLGELLKPETKTNKLFNSITISEKCVFCGMCAKFCPTDALKINETRTEIHYNASKCVSCMLCKSACYHNVLSYDEALLLKNFFNDILLVSLAEKP